MNPSYMQVQFPVLVLYRTVSCSSILFLYYIYSIIPFPYSVPGIFSRLLTASHFRTEKYAWHTPSSKAGVSGSWLSCNLFPSHWQTKGRAPDMSPAKPDTFPPVKWTDPQINLPSPHISQKKKCSIILIFSVFPNRLGLVIKVTLSPLSHHSFMKPVLSI